MDWGKGILLAIIGFIVIIMTMVVISVRMEGIELVTENYYEAEINYQDQIDKEKSTLTLEREVLQFDAENQSLFLDLPVGATGILHLFRPSDSKLDQKLTVEIKEENEKTVSIRNLQAGYWKAQLSWQENGESYYQEKKISLK